MDALSNLNHNISLQQAQALIATHKRNKESILKAEWQRKDTLPVCETFNRELFDQLLSQQGCFGIRIYYGMSSENQLRLVLVGVDSQEQDILPSSTSDVRTDTGTIGEAGRICPPWCSPSAMNP